MRVVFTPLSNADLRDVGLYIARDNPGRAAAFVQALYETCVAIGQLPFGAAVMPRYRKQGFRRKPYRGYLIIYRVSDNRVEIARVLQGARDIGRALSSGDA